jgi:chorismate mutase
MVCPPVSFRLPSVLPLGVFDAWRKDISKADKRIKKISSSLSFKPLPLHSMSFFKQGNGPFVIAGPCSAESEAQVMETARQLKTMPVQLFRAGVWKPRTRPGSFEGMGIEALQWLKNIKEEINIPVAIEVAEPQHVELAIQYGIDVLWIGARTTVNPFQVQRIADALKGVQIPLMVKNPVNPDVSLWLGAIERLENVGINDIAAVHRGFSLYHAPGVYRNHPNWPVPIELKRRRPELPVICDPSHITGRASMVAEIAQRAMDMGFEGLMIETHPHPEKALSDAEQQITPAELNTLLNNLVVRQGCVTDDKALHLEHLRQLMDSVDIEIIDLLARRMELSEKIGLVKKECNMTAYQPERWREIVETRTRRGKKYEMEEAFIVALYQLIHDESIRKQLEIMQDAFKPQND